MPSPSDTDSLPPATPAATVVIFRTDPDGGPPLLCMVERSAKMAFAPGAAVFPGGRVDPDDYDLAERLAPELEREEGAARIAAIRETLEETGLSIGIIAGGAHPGSRERAEVRAALNDGVLFSELLEERGWSLDLARFTYWARWRPPGTIEKRVFDTRFYIADAGDAVLRGEADRTENTSLFWASAREVLRRADAGAISVIFPTRRNLERLALFSDFEAARVHADSVPVRMVLTYVEERADGEYICLPDGHGYPVLEEPMSRALRG